LALKNLSGIFLNAKGGFCHILVRRVSIISRMKPPPNIDVLADSNPVWPPRESSKELKQSLFSLLLEIESRLRAETRSSVRRAGKKHAFKDPFYQRPSEPNLSRYVE